MSIPKELLVPGDMLQQISEEDAGKDLELQSVIPSVMKPISVLRSTSPSVMPSSQPKNLTSVGQPEEKKVFFKLPSPQKPSSSNNPIPPSKHKRSKPNDSQKRPSPEPRKIIRKVVEVKKKKSAKELAGGDGKCNCKRKPNRVSKEYKEAAELKILKAQNVVAIDYKEILNKFPAQSFIFKKHTSRNY